MAAALASVIFCWCLLWLRMGLLLLHWDTCGGGVARTPTKGGTGCVGELLVIRVCRAGGGSSLQGWHRTRDGRRAVLLLPVDVGLLEAQQPPGLLTAQAHDGVDQFIHESFCPVPQASQQLLD